MNSILLLALAMFAFVLGQNSFAQDASKPASPTAPKDAGASASAEKPKMTQEALEADFKATLTKATFKGRWCSTKEGQLGAEKEDKYTIQSITKIGGEIWLISARIQYGKNDFVAPIPVQVQWAGDTPVIVLDKVGVAGSGEFSARVLVYEHKYAGTWSGGDHGGLLNGVITSEKE